MPIKGTRKFHKFVGITENKVFCFESSETPIYSDHCVSQITSLALQLNDIVACVYDGQWWFADVEKLVWKTMA